MNLEENIPYENEQEEVESLPIVIRRLDKVETTGFPLSNSTGN
ncbi:hypothetical protein AB0K60_16335 [Thermopolyspora sp. NPDC052614]